LIVLFVVLVLIAAAVIARWWLRRLPAAPGPGAPADEGEWLGEGPTPVLAKKSSYRLGMDNFDESFPIEAADGSFKGECGFGVSEYASEETPKRAVAFDVWLFDKSDIRTVTKVLLSEQAYNNDAMRNKLAARGETVLAQPGSTLTLQTASLVVEARVAELAYGEGQPPSSYFSNLTVSLVARIRPAGAAEPVPEPATPQEQPAEGTLPG
jgi:hypothetical protein